MSTAILLPLLLAAPGAAALPAESTSLVLIVASNHGARLDRPPLQYADDDGAKYQAVFAEVAGAENTILLTDLDRDTARLFPALVPSVRPPTRANVDAVGRLLARKSADARRAGRNVRFYFVFAGHGDVDRGRGFLELPDGPFTADDLLALLHSVDAAESHVILDSCNSFFVVNPRRPGGRRFATPRDAAEHLARRLPNVGVFISTSAEAEVYEWSELQSGIFSHAVRSGLMGGADVDRDGRVSYLELAAFVDTATAEIKNPLFRPKVYARGPGGRDDDSILDLRGTRARAVTVEEPDAVRLTVRDREGLRWLDVHAEPGASLDLWVPGSLPGPLELARLKRAGPEAGAIEAVHLLEGGSARVARLAGLARIAQPPGSRGTGDVFRGLFSRPFGPKALSAYAEERERAPEPVFGISREQGERMALLLEELAASERERRTVYGSIWAVAGAGTAAFTGASLRDAARADRPKVAAIGFGLAALQIGLGVDRLARRSAGERALDHFRWGIGSPGADQARVVAETDARLRGILQGEGSSRSTRIIVGGVLLWSGTDMLVRPETYFSTPTREARNGARLVGTAMACSGLALIVATFVSDNPTEKLIELWSKDPGRERMPTLSAAPAPGGGMLLLTGEFR